MQEGKNLSLSMEKIIRIITVSKIAKKTSVQLIAMTTCQEFYSSIQNWIQRYSMSKVWM